MLGKPVGIVGFSLAAVRLGVAELPAGVAFGRLCGVGFLGGIGFTMSLFIAMLAFGEGAVLHQAKIGVMAASVLAAMLGYGLLRLTLPEPIAAGARPATAT